METPEDSLSPFDLAMGAANKVDPNPDFDGPVRNRRFTDPFCLIFLLVTWGITSWIGVWSIQNGKYDTLSHPVDYKGRVCGVDKGLNGQVLPSFWHPVDALSNGVCVDDCPTSSNFAPSSRSELFCKDDEDLLTMQGCTQSGTVLIDLSLLVTCGGCTFQTESKSLNGYCNPLSASSIIDKVNEAAVNQGMEALDEWKNFKYASYIQRLMRDLIISFPIIGGAGVGGAAFLGLLFLLMARCPSCIAPLTWISAVLAPAALGGGGTFLFFLADAYALDQSGMHSSFKATFVLILAYAIWSLAGVVLFSIVIMRKEICNAISIAKAASRAIREITFVPLFAIGLTVAYALMIGVLTFWFLMLAASRSSTETVTTVFGFELTYTAQEHPILAHYMFWFLIFVALWTSEFISAIGKLSLSHAFCGWYFTPEKEEGNHVSMTRSTYMALFYHAGTAAFGSLFIKPIVFLRAPIHFLQSCIKRSGLDNTCVDALICCCQCNLFVFERFLKFASKKAYLHTSIFGSSFCKSSHESYFLKLRNADLLTEAGPVSLLSVVYQKVLITSGVSLGSYVLLDIYYGEELFSIVSVTAVIAVLVWYVAEIFTDVLGEAVSTIMYCNTVDEEMMGDEGAQFATPELDEFLDSFYEDRNKLVIGDATRTYDEGFEVSQIPKSVDLI